MNMKKAYSRPDILFDSFSMCSAIASTCEASANFARDVCGVEMTPSISLFLEGVTGCSWIVKEEEYDGLCYHVPFDTNNVFNS